jgi:hypothetical protein
MGDRQPEGQKCAIIENVSRVPPLGLSPAGMLRELQPLKLSKKWENLAQSHRVLYDRGTYGKIQTMQ